MTTYERDVDRSTRRPRVEAAQQLPVPRALALHLLPGIAAAVIFYASAPAFMRAGYPAIAAAVAAIAIAVVAGELGWLLYQARRRSGRWSISAVLPYRPGPFTWREAVLVVGLLSWAFLAVAVLGRLRPAIIDGVFPWMPEWAVTPLPPGSAESATSTALITTAVGLIVFNVILGPVVEELYFRGYLLPRLARFGAWSALINVSLFALYHFWKPWDVLQLIVVLAPMVYVVWRTRDIRIGIAVHVGLNGLSFLLSSASPLLGG